MAALGGPAYCFDARPVGEYQGGSSGQGGYQIGSGIQRYQVGPGVYTQPSVGMVRRGSGDAVHQEAPPSSPKSLAASASGRGVGGAMMRPVRPKVKDQRPKTVQVQAGEQGGEARPMNRWRHHVAPRVAPASASAHRAVPAPAVYSIYTL